MLREIFTNSLKHPNIVDIKESFLTPGGKFITISELALGNLIHYREKLKSLSTQRIAEIMLNICLGLEFTHKKGIIHRDISPDNILFFDDDTFKICDFGLAAFAKTSVLCTGKDNYMAPEVRKS